MKLDTNKPVFILAHGTSITELESWIDQYKDLDVYWASFNYFMTTEEILNLVGLHTNILYVYCQLGYKINKEYFLNYFNSGDDRVAIINNIVHIMNIFPSLKESYKTKMLVWNTNVNGGTLMNFMVTLMQIGFKRLCLFGVDGYGDGVRTHYKQSYRAKRFPVVFNNITINLSNYYDVLNMLWTDTKKLNNIGGYYLKEYKNVEINNCNPESLVTCFDKIKYNQVKEIYQ